MQVQLNFPNKMLENRLQVDICHILAKSQCEYIDNNGKLEISPCKRIIEHIMRTIPKYYTDKNQIQLYPEEFYISPCKEPYHYNIHYFYKSFDEFAFDCIKDLKIPECLDSYFEKESNKHLMKFMKNREDNVDIDR